MVSNFAFLHARFPALENLGRLAEQYCMSDPNAALIKLGMLAEAIVSLAARYDRIDFEPDADSSKKIAILQRKGILTNTMAQLFHFLRLNRNKAAHEGLDSASVAKGMLQFAHSLSAWFMRSYGDAKAVIPPYTEPQPGELPAESAPATPKQEEATEKKLLAEAEAVADKAKALPEPERLKLTAEAASKWEKTKTEAETRAIIDAQLRAVGWEADTPTLRHSAGTRPVKGRNFAIAEWPTDSSKGKYGLADYALFVGMQLVGFIEAKAKHKDIPAIIDNQCKEYASHVRADDAQYKTGDYGKDGMYGVPFIFATNGREYIEQWKEKSGIWFQDLRDPTNAPKAFTGWPSPQGMMEWLKQDAAKSAATLADMDKDFLTDPAGLNLRAYQLRAIKTALDAIAKGQRQILLAMATGTGKTRTVLGLLYTLLKAERFRRVLFLVDRNFLGKQAQDVFAEVKLESTKTLNQIYEITKLGDAKFEPSTRIHVATVQSMIHRLMYTDETEKPAVSDYDLVIVDEAHRGYYLDKEMSEQEYYFRDQADYQSKYRQVLDYFDAVKVALTATPALQTTEIFGPPVFEYSYGEAVIEGYLADHEPPFKINTELNTQGIHYSSGDNLVLFDPITMTTNSHQVQDELDFEVDKFNKQVMSENFNRVVLEEVARHIDPEDPRQGKTLIYAVSDEHADKIVAMLKEIYSKTGVDTSAVMKITASIGSSKYVQDQILRFKNEQFPSIAVTVDLLTTGMDVPAITSLVFMRQVRSRILFEQMLGRATRLCPEIGKTHFTIYDAVGIYEKLEPVTVMKPVVANPKVTFTQLLKELDEVTDAPDIACRVNQIVAKLQAVKRRMTPEAEEQFTELTGCTPKEFTDRVLSMTQSEAKKYLLDNKPVFEYLDAHTISRHRGIVINDDPDEVISVNQGYGPNGDQRPEDYLESFRKYVTDNKEENDILRMVCTRPKDLTRDGLRSLVLALSRSGYTARALNSAIAAQGTNQAITADIITLIRRYALGSPLISHQDRVRDAVAKLRAAHSFSKQEENWINRIEQYLLNQSILNMSVFAEDKRFKNDGGATRLNKIFQGKLEEIVTELNGYLYPDTPEDVA